MARSKKESSEKQYSPASVSYAKSLLELANERQLTESIGRELAEIAQVVRENQTFLAFLADPGVGHDERHGVMDRVFNPHVSPLMKNFLGVLNVKGALRLLPQIADAFEDLWGEQMGKIEVDVIVAQRLTPDELEQVRQRVSAALKKDAVVHQYVDENIIGGLVIRVQDKLIDASVRNQLDAMKKQLLSTRV